MKAMRNRTVLVALFLAAAVALWIFLIQRERDANNIDSNKSPLASLPRNDAALHASPPGTDGPQTDSSNATPAAAPKVYELPPELQRKVTFFALTPELVLEPKIVRALELTERERDNLNKMFAKVRTRVTEWETAKAEVIPGTNIIRIPPGGPEMKNLVDSLKAEVLAEIGNDRGNFLLLKAEPKLQVQTGLYGSFPKMIRVTSNREADGSISADAPYLVEEKVIHNEDYVNQLDLTNPSTFSSESVSNFPFSMRFKTIPERYAHLIELPAAE